MDSGLCIYHLFIWSNLNFLYNSQWITLPKQSCLALYSFCANLLHSLIIVSSLSPHNLVFWCTLSILALIELVLMALFCTAIRRYSVSLLRFPFLSHVQVFLLRTQSTLLFTHIWRENNWIQNFPKDISAMWNVISLIQDLNCVHFLQRLLLHHGCYQFSSVLVYVVFRLLYQCINAILNAGKLLLLLCIIIILLLCYIIIFSYSYYYYHILSL